MVNTSTFLKLGLRANKGFINHDAATAYGSVITEHYMFDAKSVLNLLDISEMFTNIEKSRLTKTKMLYVNVMLGA